jgi:hypothetical protein
VRDDDDIGARRGNRARELAECGGARLFSFGETTEPPSVTSMFFSTLSKPASFAV